MIVDPKTGVVTQEHAGESVAAAHANAMNIAFAKESRQRSGGMFRVISRRVVDGKEITHWRWFMTEEAANGYMEWVRNGRGSVESMVEFVYATEIDRVLAENCRLKERVDQYEKALRDVLAGRWSMTGVQEILGDV